MQASDLRPEVAYGADASGLIYGFRFAADGLGRLIESGQALALLEACQASREGFVWLHFNLAHARSLSWLQQHVDLPEAFLDMLHHRSGSTRLEAGDGALAGVLNDVVYDFLRDGALQVSSLWLHADARCLISVRSQPLRSVDRLREAVRRGEAFNSPMALLNHLLRDQGDTLVDIVRRASDNIDRLEDHFLADRLPDRAVLGLMRRDLVRLQRLLAPEPAALFRLLNRPPAWMNRDDADDLQGASEEFSVALRDMNGLQERIKLLQEEIVARIGERTNRSVFVLTAVTVVALPINLTSGLFGMNVGGIPLSQHPAGFWIVLMLVLGGTGLAAWLAHRHYRGDSRGTKRP